MENNTSNLAYFYMVLPAQLEVEIHRAKKGGFWASVKNLPGCYTQADNSLELIEMINDAVFTYYEVPEKIRGALGVYLPKNIKERIDKQQKDMEEESRKKQVEDMVNKIISSRGTVKFDKVA